MNTNKIEQVSLKTLDERGCEKRRHESRKGGRRKAFIKKLNKSAMIKK